MAEKWKTEYHIIAEDGDASDWLDTLEDAIKNVEPDTIRIEKVISFYDERETVWERGK